MARSILSLNSMVYNPLAEQNRIAAQVSQDQWTRATWYNQPISSEQTPEGYMNLPAVTDPEDSSCTLEYKAQALGLKTLLYEGNRIKDNLGNPLNLDSVFGDLYYLKRNREQDGDRVSVIDCMTDRITANLIFEAMNNYYKTKYSWDVTRNVDINQKITHDGIVLFNYNLYDIPEVGVQLAVFHDPFFDDLINVTVDMMELATTMPPQRIAHALYGSLIGPTSKSVSLEPIQLLARVLTLILIAYTAVAWTRLSANTTYVQRNGQLW